MLEKDFFSSPSGYWQWYFILPLSQISFMHYYYIYYFQNVTLTLWLLHPFPLFSQIYYLLVDLQMPSTLWNLQDLGQSQSRNSFFLPTVQDLLSPKACHRACFMLYSLWPPWENKGAQKPNFYPVLPNAYYSVSFFFI